jgi:hypothetical protein
VLRGVPKADDQHDMAASGSTVQRLYGFMAECNQTVAIDRKLLAKRGNKTQTARAEEPLATCKHIRVKL